MRISWNILKKSVSETLNIREQQQLEQWLSESWNHRHFYATIKKFYSTSAEKLELSDDEVDAAWQRFNIRIEKQNSPWKRVRIAAAACVATAAMVSGLWTLNEWAMPTAKEEQLAQIKAGTTQAILSVGDHSILLSDAEQDGEWQKLVENNRSSGLSTATATPQVIEQIRIEVPKGGEYRLRLPDSTTVWLNSETIIEYQSEFCTTNRSITLSGEAFFDVAHDPTRPFLISTPDRLEIRVLGTRFNVSNYLDVDQAQITLVEGLLAVSNGITELTLQPCQQALFDRSEGTLTHHNIEHVAGYCAWTNGTFDFKEQPLETILGAVAKWYDIRIVCDPAAAWRFDAVTLQCDRRSDFSHIMHILQKVTGLHYQIEGKTVYISF